MTLMMKKKEGGRERTEKIKDLNPTRGCRSEFTVQCLCACACGVELIRRRRKEIRRSSGGSISNDKGEEGRARTREILHGQA